MVNLNDFIIKAPRKGLTKDQIKKYINKPLLKDLEADEPITRSHFVKNKKLNSNDFDFLDLQNISIPIRFHDMEDIFQEFKIRNYEFHLSYKDVSNISISMLKKKHRLFENKIFSYHLPDYINSHQLFDPLSKDPFIQKESIKILNKVIKISEVASKEDKNPIVFVSSLSQNDYIDKDLFLKKLKLFIDELYEKSNVLFLPSGTEEGMVFWRYI